MRISIILFLVYFGHVIEKGLEIDIDLPTEFMVALFVCALLALIQDFKELL